MKEEVFSVLSTEGAHQIALYQALEWAGRCGRYAAQAENLRDRTLARFFRSLQQESCEQAEQTRELLQQHTGLFWNP